MNIEETGKLISEIRKEKGLTQKQLAERLGVSDRTISKWERGAGFPDVSLLTPLADILGCSVTELLNGTRSVHGSEEQSMRDAVLVCYQQAKHQVRKNTAKIAAAVVLMMALICAGGFMIHHLSKDRVLFPPEIISEVILDEGKTSGELLLKNALTGVYHHTCRYVMEPYGRVDLHSKNEWQSYEDTVSKALHKKLKSLSAQELLGIQKTETGTLCDYAEMIDGQAVHRYTIVETDAQGEPVFQYKFDLQDRKKDAYLTGCVTTDQLSLLFRNEDTAFAENSCLIVNKGTGVEKEYPLTYRQLSGDPESTKSLLECLFNGENMWVEDDTFYFAVTRFDRGSSAIMGAYDLNRQESLAFLEVEDAQVVNVRQKNGVLQVLVNPKHYADLMLYSMDMKTGEFLGSVPLKLPYEFLADREASTEGYYLFTSDLNDNMIMVLFEANADLQEEMRHYILVGYQPDSGEMLYRSRLSVDTDYEIYGVENFKPEQAE